MPVRGRSQWSFGCDKSRCVARLTGQVAGAVIGKAAPRKTASGQSRRSSAERERLRSVSFGHTMGWAYPFLRDTASRCC